MGYSIRDGRGRGAGQDTGSRGGGGGDQHGRLAAGGGALNAPVAEPPRRRAARAESCAGARSLPCQAKGGTSKFWANDCEETNGGGSHALCALGKWHSLLRTSSPQTSLCLGRRPLRTHLPARAPSGHTPRVYRCAGEGGARLNAAVAAITVVGVCLEELVSELIVRFGRLARGRVGCGLPRWRAVGSQRA